MLLSAAGGAHWPLATYRCPSLEPSPSAVGGAHRPLTALCPPSPSLAYPSLCASLSFPSGRRANGAPLFPCSVSEEGHCPRRWPGTCKWAPPYRRWGSPWNPCAQSSRWRAHHMHRPPPPPQTALGPWSLGGGMGWGSHDGTSQTHPRPSRVSMDEGGRCHGVMVSYATSRPLRSGPGQARAAQYRSKCNALLRSARTPFPPLFALCPRPHGPGSPARAPRLR